jgi:hypothetical protein
MQWNALTFHVQTLFLFPLGVRWGLARLGQDCTAGPHRHLHFHFPPVQILIKFENSWVVPQPINKDTRYVRPVNNSPQFDNDII